MAANVKNVLVGAAQLFVSTGSNADRPKTTINSQGLNWGTQKASGYLDGSSNWRDVGYTSTGLEVSYEPGYTDVTVDQLLDAARLFQQSLKITIKSELDEATFENMNIVWGQPEYVVNQGPQYNVNASAIVNNLSSISSVATSGGQTASAAVQLNHDL